MKVSKLIKELSKFNPDADVSLTTSEDICLSYINENGATPKTTKQLFIEPTDTCRNCNFYDEGYCNAYNKKCESVEECYRYDEIGEQEQ